MLIQKVEVLGFKYLNPTHLGHAHVPAALRAEELEAAEGLLHLALHRHSIEKGKSSMLRSQGEGEEEGVRACGIKA